VDFAEQLFYGVVALNALFASLVWCVVAPHRVSLTALVVCAVVWPFVNGPLEGHILWRIDEQHGITVSDLLSVAALAVAAVKFRTLRR
jgi:hypothetical protein